MEGKRRDDEDIQDSLVVQEGMVVKFPLVPVATFAAPASSLFFFFSSSFSSKTKHYEISVDSRGNRSPTTRHTALFARTV